MPLETPHTGTSPSPRLPRPARLPAALRETPKATKAGPRWLGDSQGSQTQPFFSNVYLY